MQWIVELLASEIVPRVASIALFVAVGVALANLAVEFGAVEYVAVLSKPLTGPANLPDEVGAAIAPQLGAPFTPREAVATMLIGGVVSFAFSTFKRSIPFQYGIWGPAFGTKVILVNTALKVGFLALTVALLLI